jgi:hypothetical protein
MKPIRVSIEVPRPREDVYDFLDVMANHEPFTEHTLTDWAYYGPARGVGSGARVRAEAGGRTDHVSIEVVDAARPIRITEKNVGAGGRRIATGTYELAELPRPKTLITFTYEWARTPLEERLAAPAVRAILRHTYKVAMARLAEQLVGQTSPHTAPGDRESNRTDSAPDTRAAARRGPHGDGSARKRRR